MKSFQERLIYAMSKRNLKQSDLVKMTGINKAALSSYINGRYIPKAHNIRLLSEALDIEKDWFLGEDEKTNVSIIEKLEKVRNIESIQQKILEEYELPNDMEITDSMMLGYLLGYINRILERGWAIKWRHQ